MGCRFICENVVQMAIHQEEEEEEEGWVDRKLNNPKIFNLFISAIDY